MNNAEDIWDRILGHCSANSNNPEHTFKTKTGLVFYLVKVNDKCIRPCPIGRVSKLYDIPQAVIHNDIFQGRPIATEKVSDYNTPAPAYRYALFHDKRIFI